VRPDSLTCALAETVEPPSETQVRILPLDDPYPQLFVDANAVAGETKRIPP